VNAFTLDGSNLFITNNTSLSVARGSRIYINNNYENMYAFNGRILCCYDGGYEVFRYDRVNGFDDLFGFRLRAIGGCGYIGVYKRAGFTLLDMDCHEVFRAEYTDVIG
jgi:hypothetical protein